jgi:3-methylcrotonyl-CoA carboxylase alpha subunit
MVLRQRPVTGFTPHLPQDPPLGALSLGAGSLDRRATQGAEVAASSPSDLQVLGFVRRVLHQATDPTMVVPMLLASPVYHLGKASLLRNLVAKQGATWLSRGLSLKLSPVAAGFIAENTVFSLASRSMTHHLVGPVNWDAQSLANDWASSAMALGLLKSAGFAGRKATEWARGMDDMQPQLWSRADHRAMFWTSQASAYLGLVGSHALQARIFPETHIPGGNIWVDALGTHLALGMGAHAGRRALGPRFQAFEQQLASEAHRLSQTTQTPFNIFGFPSGILPAAAAPSGARMVYPPGERSPASENIFKSEARDSDPYSFPPGSLTPAVPSSRPPPAETVRHNVLRGKYVVIGNRGEPAVRAVNTVKEMGGTPIVLVSDADRESLHATLDGVMAIPLKGRESNETYNNIEKRMEGLERLMKARGIVANDVIAWEGWGFKSEDPELVEQYERRGIAFAGAPSESHRLMGDKVSARKVAQEAGVPVVPGSGEMQSMEEAKAYAREIGYPVIIKGKDTGGGKGIREVHREEDFAGLFQEAQDQAYATANSRAMFVEKFISEMRHLEVQVMADGNGQSVVVGIRECTLQRKKQKVVEEDVSMILDPKIKELALRYAKQIMAHEKLQSYKGPGTLEMIWDVRSNQLYFMEMNTRLQVEHTVTEMATGKNLLKAQLELAAGLPLSFAQVTPRYHAIEVRITSEDPYKDFIPSTGRILHYREPQSGKTGRYLIRVDSGVEVGRVITADYDSMIAKLIVRGNTREDAIEGLQIALDQFEILGVTTNIPFLKKLIASGEFQTMQWGNTRFIEEKFLSSPAGRPDYGQYPRALVTAAIQTYLKRKDAFIGDRQAALRGEKLNRRVEMDFQGQTYTAEVFEEGPGKFLVGMGSHLAPVELTRSGENLFNLTIDGVQRRGLIGAYEGRREVNLNNVVYSIKIKGEGDLGPGVLKAPLAGKVVELFVKPGDRVEKGQTLLTVEAMKNKNHIGSAVAGVVKVVHIRENQQVQEGILMIEVEPEQAIPSDIQAVPEPGPKEFQGSPLESIAELGQSELVRIHQKKIGEITNEDRNALMGYFRSYFKGYDVPFEILQSSLPLLKSPSHDGREGMQGFLTELIVSYMQTEALFSPADWSNWMRYRQLGVFSDARYETQLNAALKSYGIEQAAPGPELEEALFRLQQSHDRRRGKAGLLEKILPWIPEYQLAGLNDVLTPLARFYVDGVPKDFSVLVTENQRLLRKKLGGAQEIQSLERLFNEALEDPGEQALHTSRAIFAHGEDMIPFLMGQAERVDQPAASQLALRLLNAYHYGEQFDVGSFDHKVDGQWTALTPRSGVREKGIHLSSVGLWGALNQEKFETALKQAMDYFPPLRESSDDQPVRAIELILGGSTPPEVLTPYLDALPQVLKDQAVDRVTLIFQKAPGHITYRTFEKSAETSLMEENTLLRGIHPRRVGEFRLHRWIENFDMTHLDHVLPDVNNVYIYHARAKRHPNDRRHIVIGEHRGPLTVELFDGERTRHRLINDYRHLLTNPRHSLDKDSRVAWSFLPAALKATGVVGNGFDPFSLGVLRSSPAEMIQRFNLTEEILGTVAAYYEGKVKSALEVERVVENFGNAMDQVRGQEIPAVADIFIREPIEMSNDEIRLMAYRLAPFLVGKLLEKTTVHFKRREGDKIKSFIAEITIPGETRFEVKFDESKTDLPHHRVRTALEKKIIDRQAQGKPYIYGAIDLFRDVLLEEFYPKGNAPENPITIQEMALGADGALVNISRGWGENDLSKVAFQITLKMPQGAEGTTRSFMVIADDWTVNRGAMGRSEGALFKAVVDRAIAKGIPQLYLAESVGAYIGFPRELWPYLHYEPEVDRLYVESKDLEISIPEFRGKKLRDLLQTGEPDGFRGGKFLPVTVLIGAEQNNTESLEGSGMAGEAQDRGHQQIPTATIVMGPSVGITTYLAQWSKFIIMLKDSFLGLTGVKVINNTFGSEYKSEQEIHGSEVMADNGVASLVVPDTKQALRAYLRWLSYQPAQMGQAAPHIQPSAGRRDARFSAAMQGLISQRGATFSTQEMDRALFDPGSVFYVKGDGTWGRRVNTGYARLSGIPVGIASMEMRPKLLPGEKPEKAFPGALGPDDSLKFAEHIDQVGRLGIPFIFNDTLTGFLPRLGDHQDRVIPAGAQILSALRTFPQPFINMVQPFGNLFGGAWVVFDRNINPNIVTVAFDNANLGILGASAAADLPKAERLHERDPLKLKKAQAMAQLQNHARRAFQVGSIHHLIEDASDTPTRLHQILIDKMAVVRSQQAARQQRETLLRQVIGTLELRGWEYKLLPDGRIEYFTPDGTMTTTLAVAKAFMSMSMTGSPLDTLRQVGSDRMPPGSGDDD